MPDSPASSRDLAAAIAARKAATLDAARPEAMAKRERDGKLSARARIDALLDPESFLERQPGSPRRRHRRRLWHGRRAAGRRRGA